VRSTLLSHCATVLLKSAVSARAEYTPGEQHLCGNGNNENDRCAAEHRSKWNADDADLRASASSAIHLRRSAFHLRHSAGYALDLLTGAGHDRSGGSRGGRRMSPQTIQGRQGCSAATSALRPFTIRRLLFTIFYFHTRQHALPAPITMKKLQSGKVAKPHVVKPATLQPCNPVIFTPAPDRPGCGNPARPGACRSA
jgi:hypothetical protein